MNQTQQREAKGLRGLWTKRW